MYLFIVKKYILKHLPPFTDIKFIENINIYNFLVIGKHKYFNKTNILRFLRHKNVMEICYLAKGKHEVLINNKNYVIKGGDIYLVRPNELHGSPSKPNANCLFYWFMIGDKKHIKYKKNCHNESIKLIDTVLSIKKRIFRGDNKIQTILDEILFLLKQKDKYKTIKLKILYIQLLLHIVELSKKNKDISSDIINEVDKYISKNVNNNIHIKSLAEITNLSLSHFKTKFKNLTGIPPNEYILLKKINFAKQLLANKQYKIIDVSAHLGFSSSQYFSNVFKKVTGLSPSAFKKLKQ